MVGAAGGFHAGGGGDGGAAADRDAQRHLLPHRCRRGLARLLLAGILSLSLSHHIWRVIIFSLSRVSGISWDTILSHSLTLSLSLSLSVSVSLTLSLSLSLSISRSLILSHSLASGGRFSLTHLLLAGDSFYLLAGDSLSCSWRVILSLDSGGSLMRH